MPRPWKPLLMALAKPFVFPQFWFIPPKALLSAPLSFPYTPVSLPMRAESAGFIPSSFAKAGFSWPIIVEASALPKSPLITARTVLTLIPNCLASRPKAKLDAMSPNVTFPSAKSLMVIARLMPGIISEAALAIGPTTLVKSVAATTLSAVCPGLLVKRPSTPTTGTLRPKMLLGLTFVTFPSPID